MVGMLRCIRAVVLPQVGRTLAIQLHCHVVVQCNPHCACCAVLSQAGRTLAEIHSMRDLYSPRNVVAMLIIGGAALVPVAFKWRQQKKERRRKGPGGAGGGLCLSGSPGSGGGVSTPKAGVQLGSGIPMIPKVAP